MRARRETQMTLIKQARPGRRKTRNTAMGQGTVKVKQETHDRGKDFTLNKGTTEHRDNSDMTYKTETKTQVIINHNEITD